MPPCQVYLVFDEQYGGSKTQDVHQAIPANLQWADRENNRVNVWKGQHDFEAKVKSSLSKY
jgi:hypothetical protein